MNKRHPLFAMLLKACVAVATTLVAGASASAAPQQGSTGSLPVPISQTDRLIIKYKDSGSKQKGVAVPPPMTDARQEPAQRVGRQFGLSMKAHHTIGTGAHVFQLNRRVTLDEARKIAKQIVATDPNVEYAEPDQLLQPMFTPNDPRYAEQWNYHEIEKEIGGINMPLAWYSANGTGIVVAVLDTGYRPHADLTGKILPGYNFMRWFYTSDDNARASDATDPGDAALAGECEDGNPQQDRPSSWHGTHVAGTIAANTNNSSGVAGVAFNAKILPARVAGKCGAYISNIADAIVWSAGGIVQDSTPYGVIRAPDNPNKARVINVSLGGSGSCSPTMQIAINEARSFGSVVVVPAGNANTDAANTFPANCAGVITVAATDRSGGRARYSNFGAVVDVAAPGGDMSVKSENGVLSTLNAGITTPGADSYGYHVGTSIAAAHVSGTVALMLSLNPLQTPDEVEARLKSSARAFPASCSNCGAGIVNPNNALSAGAGDTFITESESNDSLSDANSITNRHTVVNGTIGSTSDNDYFKAEVPAGATFSAMMTPSNAAANYDLSLYEVNGTTGTLLSTSKNGAGAIDSVSVTNTRSTATTYAVKVKYYAGPTGSTTGANAKYTLKVSW